MTPSFPTGRPSELIPDAPIRAELAQAIAEVQALDHDALVEPFLDGSDVEVPVITLDGAPAMLPMMIFEQADPTHLRTYTEKRNHVERSAKSRLCILDDTGLADRIVYHTRQMAQNFRQFNP